MKLLCLSAWLALFVMGPAASAQPDWRAEPAFGTAHLQAGFQPDPHAVALQAGGTDRNPISGSGCAGYIRLARPDLDLLYEADRGRLSIYVHADDDTTLLVNDASGRWHCSDDFEGSNPAIILDNPGSGHYNIWIGTYEPSEAGVDATVYVSELMPTW